MEVSKAKQVVETTLESRHPNTRAFAFCHSSRLPRVLAKAHKNHIRHVVTMLSEWVLIQNSPLVLFSFGSPTCLGPVMALDVLEVQSTAGWKTPAYHCLTYFFPTFIWITIYISGDSPGRRAMFQGLAQCLRHIYNICWMNKAVHKAMHLII